MAIKLLSALMLVLCLSSLVSASVDSAAAEAAEAAAEAEIDDSDLDIPITEPEKPIDRAASAEAVTALYFLPKYADLVFPAGEQAEILIGLSNTGTKSRFSISLVEGSLNYPQDMRYVIQNFTKQAPFGVSLGPKEETTLSYTFRPDAALEPRQFGLVVSVVYTDETGRNFTLTPFNTTVNVGEPISTLDVPTFVFYVVVASILAYLVYFAIQSSSSPKSRSKRVEVVSSSTSSSSKATAESDANDWLVGTAAERDARKRTSRSRSPASASRKTK